MSDITPNLATLKEAGTMLSAHNAIHTSHIERVSLALAPDSCVGHQPGNGLEPRETEPDREYGILRRPKATQIVSCNESAGPGPSGAGDPQP
ncbi:unnamed protein product [Aspergillus oryzae]|uniref:Unnamed protein product n=1 Tax=Aspergillus oryzae TaxID=5062 RepID=A0AAN4YID8_ASPOZ|nr:unnamed protein product [Aspergillus oryzae]